jgi:hypothetical protein
MASMAMPPMAGKMSLLSFLRTSSLCRSVQVPAVLGGREAVPPKPVLAAGGVDLKKQAAAVRDPVSPRSLWQSANFLVG